MPVFSPDGRYIAAQSICYPEINEGCTDDVAGSQIALIDVDTQEYRLITQGRFLHDYPGFSPDGNSLACTIAKRKEDLRQVGFPSYVRQNLKTGIVTVLFPNTAIQTQFAGVGSLSWVGPREYILSARKPLNDDHLGAYLSNLDDLSGKEERAKRGTWKSKIKLGYRFTEKHGFDPLPENLTHRVAQIIASADGSVKAFIDLSRSAPYGADKLFNMEIFVSESSNVRQLTNLQSLIHAPFITPDGRRIAFLSGETKEQNWDVWTIDLPDGAPKRTNLRRILIEDMKRDYQQNSGQQ